MKNIDKLLIGVAVSVAACVFLNQYLFRRSEVVAKTPSLNKSPSSVNVPAAKIGPWNTYLTNIIIATGKLISIEREDRWCQTECCILQKIQGEIGTEDLKILGQV